MSPGAPGGIGTPIGIENAEELNVADLLRRLSTGFAGWRITGVRGRWSAVPGTPRAGVVSENLSEWHLVQADTAAELYLLLDVRRRR